MTRDPSPAVVIFDRRMKEQKDYWTARLGALAGEPVGPRPDFPRRTAPSGAALATAEVRIEGPLLEKLRKLTSNGPFLVYTTITAALHAFLFRLSGDPTVRTGSPARRVEGSAPEPNALVLTSAVDGRMPFKQLLGSVRETLLAAYQHQDFPFSRLVRLLDVAETPDRAPLFDVALALEEIHGPLPDVGQDVTITFIQQPDALVGSISYKPWLFRPDTVARFGAGFLGVLREALADVARPIGDIPLLGEAERHQLVAEPNDTALGEPLPSTVHQAFEAQAERTPDAPAVACQEESLTFREFKRRANQLAQHLQRIGVKPEATVGLCLERSVDQMVGLFGILQAGGAYVPLDETWPPRRIAAIVTGGRIGVVVTRERLRERFSNLEEGLSVRTVCLDSDREALELEPATAPESGATGENLAYLLFTSGSTGEPKGVMIRHSAVLNLAAALRQAVYDRIGAGPLRVSVNGPLTFDTSVKQWVQLLHGHTLHILTEEERRDADLLLTTLERHRVDVFDCTPSLLRLLLPLGLTTGRRRAPRAVLLGGEAIDPPLWETLSRAPSPRFWNVYGPTECTVDATAWPVQGTAPALGRPIANVRLHVLGRDLDLLPLGAPGELCIAGAGLARGYTARPDLTAAAFVPDPFAQAPGERMYRTGDLARWLPDATVEFLGRIDFQVKVRGFRIELGEIEATLAGHPAVREAVVMAREDTPGDLRIVAYAVPQEGRPPKVEALRTFLAEKLADYMVPAAILLLDVLPLNANGKVDRRALPAPDWHRPAGEGAEGAAAAPRTPFEEAIAEIWTEVLGLGRVGIHDDFFDLGGHSLLAMQVLSRVLETFRIKMPLKVVFDSPTIAGMAALVESDLQGGRTVELPPLLPVARDRSLPLSFAQERLWFFDQFHPEEPAYNVGRAFRLRGKLDAAALESTFAEIVRRHEALRTVFAVEGGGPVQRVQPFRPPVLPRVDLAALPGPERERTLARLLVSEPLRPFDLDRGPLYRTALFRLAPDDHVLLVVLHHIVFDGWSLGVFLQEMRTLYPAFAAGRRSPLPDLAVQYPDFTVWQREWLQGEVLEAQLGYWKRQLAGAPPSLDLPLDHPRPALQTFRGARRDVRVPAVLSRDLQEVYRRRGSTLFMALLAGFQLLLERWTGQQDVVVGMPTANRSRLGVEGLIGFFVNTLVLRTDVSGAASFHELLDRVRDVALGAYAHQDLPFEKLIGELHPERDLARPPLIQVLFVLQNAPMEDLALPGLTLETSEVDPERVLFDLVLSVREIGDELDLSFRYNADLFDAATVGRFAEGYGRLLAHAVAAPDAPLAELALLSDEERHQLQVEWNDTAAPAADGRNVYELFAALAARDPEGAALRFEETTWTRREVLEKAESVAQRLRSQGVGPETRVAVRAERAAETVAEILGILAAGGAYVPVDPEDPEERRRWILEDAGASFALSREAGEGWGGGASAAHAHNTAYIIYTSGSTGRPKGVSVTHGALRNLVEAQIAGFDLRPEDRLLQFAALTFDASVSEIFTALVSGACLVLIPRDRMLPGLDLLARLRDERITAVTLPPSALAVLPEEDLPDLRTLIVAGEACPPELVQTWGRGRRFLNAYGPTETTVCATIEEIAAPSIGRPIAGSTVHLLDRANRLAPRGSVGEICIGGTGVARGYLNRPGLTAERFAPDPFAAEPGSRLFRTGDLGRQRPDGRIDFLGRIDHQLKLRGFRIEPGEVESVLRGHPEVRDAAVVGRPLDGLPVLVAYVVPAGEAIPEPALRDHLRQRLPAHMIPGRFVALDALPLTTRGKVDRRALPAPDTHRPGLGEGFTAPRNDAEERIAALWAEVLGLDRVGVHDDFFELGGHSLLATRLLARLQSELRIEVPVRALFEHPTVADLAMLVEPERVFAETVPLPA